MNKPNDISGQTVGQYRLIQLLGRGGMGEVYEAEHKVLVKRYALKFLPADFAARPGALERFQREAAVMARLNHRNLIQVDDFGESDGRYWLRMELAEGGQVQGQPVKTLQDYADVYAGKIPQEELLVILKQVVAALGYAHNAGVVHRDLKPTNILLTHEKDGGGALVTVPKITDFGLVHLVGDEWLKGMAEQSIAASMSMGDQPTLAGDESSGARALLGTLDYMSPEQRAGGIIDQRSDLYSMGLMVFRLLTGRKNLSFKLPSQLVPGLCPEWDELVSAALEEDPEDRMPDCVHFMSYLNRIEADTTPAPSPEPPKARPEPPPVKKESPPPPPPSKPVGSNERIQQRTAAWSRHIEPASLVRSPMIADYLVDVLELSGPDVAYKVIDGFWDYVANEENYSPEASGTAGYRKRYLVIPYLGTFRIRVASSSSGFWKQKFEVTGKTLAFKSKKRDELSKDFTRYYDARMVSSEWINSSKSKKLSVKRKIVRAIASQSRMDMELVDELFFELLGLLVRLFLAGEKKIAWSMHGTMIPIGRCPIRHPATGKRLTAPMGRYYYFKGQPRLNRRIQLCAAS